MTSICISHLKINRHNFSLVFVVHIKITTVREHTDDTCSREVEKKSTATKPTKNDTKKTPAKNMEGQKNNLLEFIYGFFSFSILCLNLLRSLIAGFQRTAIDASRNTMQP